VGEHTGIAWCDATFNPWWGCTRVSPGCKLCYAEIASDRWGHPGLWGPRGERRVFGPGHWQEPWRWNTRAEKEGVRRRVFCGSMCDVFEDYGDDEEPTASGLGVERTKLWDVIGRTHSLDWLLLTKRPENIDRMCGVMRLPNVWLGTSVEDQTRADERVPIIARQPSVVRFLSVEPMIGPVDLSGLVDTEAYGGMGGRPFRIGPAIDWVIIGGESQEGCRPMEVEWALDLLRQCRSLGIAVFVKQLGGHPDKRHDPAEWPEALRVQEFPSTINLYPEQAKLWNGQVRQGR